MKSYQKKKLEKLLVENQLEMLKNAKADHNNIILNAAAFQQDLLKEMGIKKKNLNYKKIFKINKTPNQIDNSNNSNASINNPNNNNCISEDKIHIFLPKIINKTINDEKDSVVNLRRKEFLNNLSLAQKIGLKEIPKMPLSLQEWKNIEAKTISRNDHTSNCPICLEALAKRETIILSCTHIFHKVRKNISNIKKYTLIKNLIIEIFKNLHYII